MIRFKEIFLTESFKEKVNSYNIKNPYIKNFILRYENLIDWGVVKTVKKSGDDVDGILIYDGNKYSPLISDDMGYNRGKGDSDLSSKLSSAIEANDHTLEFINNNENITMFIVNIPQMNQKWAGFYVMDNNLKTSIDPQTMKPISEAVGYLKYF